MQARRARAGQESTCRPGEHVQARTRAWCKRVAVCGPDGLMSQVTRQVPAKRWETRFRPVYGSPGAETLRFQASLARASLVTNPW